MKNNIKVVCFDLDGTLIKEQTWLILNIAMGITNIEDAMMYGWYQTGIITYHEWARLIFSIYKKRGNLNRRKIERIIFNYDYFDGAKEIVKYLKDKGHTLVLISGAMDILVKKVAQELKFDFYKANNQFIFDKNDNLIEIREEGDDIFTKVKFLKELCVSLNIKLDECACVGDGENDLGLFSATKRGITLKGTKIEKKAWQVIDDLSGLKKIL